MECIFVISFIAQLVILKGHFHGFAHARAQTTQPLSHSQYKPSKYTREIYPDLDRP